MRRPPAAVATALVLACLTATGTFRTDPVHAAEGPAVMVLSEPIRGLVEGVVSGVAEVIPEKPSGTAGSATSGARAGVVVRLAGDTEIEAAALPGTSPAVIVLGEAGARGAAWLDPEAGRQWAGQLSDALGAIDPANAAAYQANARGLRARLDALKAEMRLLLLPVAHRTVRVSSAETEPLARRYDIGLDVSEGSDACHVRLSEQESASPGSEVLNRYLRLLRRVAERLAACPVGREAR